MWEGTFGPVSNRASWAESHVLTYEDGTIPTVTEIVLSFGGGCAPVITKKYSLDEITWDSATGTFEWLVDDSDMRNFNPGSYPAGLTVTISDEPVQIVGGASTVVVKAGNVP